MREKEIQDAIRLLSKGNCRLFRNNVGLFRDSDGRAIRTGLAVGSADLIGWRRVTITPDMVGREFAQFVSVEVKGPTGKLTPDQAAWKNTVASHGGVAIVARSSKDAEEALLSGWSR